MSDEQRDWVMAEYYERRAPLLARHYQEAVMPPWVGVMVDDFQVTLRARRVLEVACSTGYWTRYAAAVAAQVVATDTSPAMLRLARAQGIPADRCRFVPADAYALETVEGNFDAGLAMQWLSHVPKHRLAVFLAAWHRRLAPGAVVFLGDNQPHEGMAEQPYAKPGEADTYELRRLPDGSCFEIVKNYFNAMELQALLAPWAADVRLHMGDYWWWLSYTAVSPRKAAAAAFSSFFHDCASRRQMVADLCGDPYRKLVNRQRTTERP
jgi:SAM-dependent methyltransferase